jgi:hypothetical protein
LPTAFYIFVTYGHICFFANIATDYQLVAKTQVYYRKIYN